MRTVYHEKLSELSEQLGRMCGLAGAAMERATRALMQADLTSAEQVITDQDQIMAMTTKAEQNGVAVCAGATRTPNRSATCSAIWAPDPVSARMKSTISGSQLDRAATAAPLVHQPRHPRLIERRRHQIERCPRITMCRSSFRHRHTLDQTRPQHLVLHLHLVGGQKETRPAGEQRRQHRIRIRMQQPRLGQRPKPCRVAVHRAYGSRVEARGPRRCRCGVARPLLRALRRPRRSCIGGLGYAPPHHDGVHARQHRHVLKESAFTPW